MPDARGRFKGQGWSRLRAEGWERAFGQNPPASGTNSSCTHKPLIWCGVCKRVPSEDEAA
jgi:hypothetical protein